jgi:hypothetical protein
MNNTQARTHTDEKKLDRRATEREREREREREKEDDKRNRADVHDDRESTAKRRRKPTDRKNIQVDTSGTGQRDHAPDEPQNEGHSLSQPVHHIAELVLCTKGITAERSE